MRQNWTKEEDRLMLQMYEEKFTPFAIAERLGRSESAIKTRIVKVGQKNNTYNIDHIQEKYEINNDFFEEILPKTILDPFSGFNRYWYSNFSDRADLIIDNDIDKKIESMLHTTALEVLKLMESLNKKFDLVDIDPYGSPSLYIDLGIKLSKKGLILTFGDLKKMRNYPIQNKDYIRNNYGLDLDISKTTLKDLVNHIIDLADKKYSKQLKVYAICNWKTCDRVYFKVGKEG